MKEWKPATQVRTQLSLRDIEFPALAKELRDALLMKGTRGARDWRTADRLFRVEIASVIQGIQSRGRFALLKRFIAFGSLCPPNSDQDAVSGSPLVDAELVRCVDFIFGHMVTKFQGKLAEILAGESLQRLTTRLIEEERLPRDARLIPGRSIRVRSRSSISSKPESAGSGVEGPDGLLASIVSEAAIHIYGVVEVKSMYVSPAHLRSQTTKHAIAAKRGVAIDGVWFDTLKTRIGCDKKTDTPPQLYRVFVQPSTWSVPQQFRFEPTLGGGRSLITENVEPLAKDTSREIDPWTSSIQLRWSRDALRGAAFGLAHRYMVEVGLALATDPEPGYRFRTDMHPSDVGPNDILHQLHVAIFRQLACEPDPKRLQKTLELYNVFGFGWALGNNYRDDSGHPSMLYPEALDELQARRHAESQ